MTLLWRHWNPLKLIMLLRSPEKLTMQAVADALEIVASLAPVVAKLVAPVTAGEVATVLVADPVLSRQ